jgi:lipopolysaccharide transport system permease protein
LLHLWKHRELIHRVTKRHVAERYKGSFLGMAWSFIQPLIMLGIYTFVFSVIFQAKWDIETEQGRAAFAMTLFTGIITFNIFGEAVNEATGIVLRHANFVKKVVFPLEILPVVVLCSVVVQALISLTILLFGLFIIGHPIPWTALLLPAAWLPMMLLSLGCAYFFASLGVFIRDIGATVGILTTMLFFLSPIFYPASAVPPEFRFLVKINPIAVFVENARGVLLWGRLPEWPQYFGFLLFAVFVFTLGFLWFCKSKPAFADVI